MTSNTTLRLSAITGPQAKLTADLGSGLTGSNKLQTPIQSGTFDKADLQAQCSRRGFRVPNPT